MVISFPLNARAFSHLLHQTATLLPASRLAIEQAGLVGPVAQAYYFIDATDGVARDLRNCLRRRRGARGLDARACDSAASAIDNRLRIAWFGERCERCAGALDTGGWQAGAGILALRCRECGWTVPE